MINYILTITTLLCFIDKYITDNNIKGAYYFNHFIINSLITYFCYNDVILCYTDFNNILNNPINFYSIYLTFSLHFYHVIMYYQKFVFDDWLHHIIMVFFSLPMSFYFNCGQIMGHSLFFMTGLPGGINYFLLFLQRNNLIEKQTQKYYNYHLNLWIRMPGCMATTTLTLLYLNLFVTDIIGIFLSLFISLSHYWNGIYFTEQVVRNYNILYP